MVAYLLRGDLPLLCTASKTPIGFKTKQIVNTSRCGRTLTPNHYKNKIVGCCVPNQAGCINIFDGIPNIG